MRVHNFQVPPILINTTYLNKTITIKCIYICTHTHTHTHPHRVCDSKKWTQLNSKRRLNTRQTFGCGITSSLFAILVDLPRLLSNLSLIRLMFSSNTRGRQEFLPLHRQPICSNWSFQRQMPFLFWGWLLKQRRNASCTAVADSVLMNSRTQNIVPHSGHFCSTYAAARLCSRRAV